MKYIESHCHLDYLKAQPIEETLQLAAEVGVDKIITIAVEPDNFQVVLDLANTYPQIYCSQGTHPHDAKLMQEKHYDIIRQNASDPKVIAIGEIGLDYHYNNSPKEVQLEVFQRQLEIAIELDMPVIIHSRDADEDMMSMLRKYAPKLNRKGVVHSFTSSIELAEVAINEGLYLGFNGIITFKKAENVRDVLRITPLDRILLETDAPFLAPVPKRGKENGPHFLPYIGKFIAETLELEESKLLEIAYKNTQRLFQI